MAADPQNTEAEVEIRVPENGTVSGLLLTPAGAHACLVLAHGAGAGMRHAFMAQLAASLATRGIATLRYQFPYVERGSSRTDPPPVCHATVRAACAAAREHFPALPLLAGGKSFGGRMTSQAQSMEPLADVRGIAFFGFPLHPPGKPGTERAKHLANVRVPLLFMQGTRDELADFALVESLVKDLGTLADAARGAGVRITRSIGACATAAARVRTSPPSWRARSSPGLRSKLATTG